MEKYEGILYVAKSLVWTIEGDDLDEVVASTRNEMTEWQWTDKNMEWYVNDGKDKTVRSGELKWGSIINHSIPRQCGEKRVKSDKVKRKKNVSTRKTDRWVKCLNNDKIYNSAAHAADELMLDPCQVAYCARHEGATTGRKNHYKFVYISKDTGEVIPYDKPANSDRYKNRKRIRCIETGEVFDGVNAAMRVYGSSVHYTLYKLNKKPMQYNFEYVDQQNLTENNENSEKKCIVEVEM